MALRARREEAGKTVVRRSDMFKSTSGVRKGTWSSNELWRCCLMSFLTPVQPPFYTQFSPSSRLYKCLLTMRPGNASKTIRVSRPFYPVHSSETRRVRAHLRIYPLGVEVYSHLCAGDTMRLSSVLAPRNCHFRKSLRPVEAQT